MMSINVKLQEYKIELDEEQKKKLLLDVKQKGVEKKVI